MLKKLLKKQECETKTQGKCRAIQKFCTICRASSRIEANRRLWIGLNPGLLVLTSNLPGCMIALKGIRDLFSVFSSPSRALSGQKGGLQGWQKRWLCSAANQSQAEGGRYEATNGNYWIGQPLFFGSCKTWQSVRRGERRPYVAKCRFTPAEYHQ